MDKKKIEKIILLILLPIFALGLFFRFAGSIRQRPSPMPKPVSSVEQKESLKTAEEAIEELKIEIKKVKYEVGKHLDPLKDKLSAYIASITPVSEIKKKVEDIKPPQLNIKGLIWNSDRPQAIVNDNVLSIGDEIEGAKLLSVSKDGIKIEYEGVEFFIEK